MKQSNLRIPQPPGVPRRQGLYDSRNEHDSCGVGFIANIRGRKSHSIIEDGLQILVNLTHRGAVGADPKAGDGAGILIQIPDAFYQTECAGSRRLRRRHGLSSASAGTAAGMRSHSGK